MSSFALTARPAGAAAAPAATSDAGDHLHDGFYLRFGLGYGTSAASTSGATYGNGFEVPEVQVEDSGMAFDLLLGGTPAHWLVLGAGFMGNGGHRPTLEVNGKRYELNGAATTLLMGAFADWFIDPEAGFHLDGAVGHVQYQVVDDDSAPAESPNVNTGWLAEVCPPKEECIAEPMGNGWGLAVFAGYDAFVSSNWSLGGYARLLTFATSEGPFGVRSRGWGAALMLTALHH
ncbi:MAG: hypothetical protein HYZ29_29830 [Myxococcales bacterium]|nr:hypothetical protein [Myxococcales bacterium]